MERALDEYIVKIENREILKFVRESLKLAPEYFWRIPSSLSGEHHPPDERGAGGLVLHTKRVVRLCEHLSRSYDLDKLNRDLLIAAAILHDTFRCGFEGRERKHEEGWGGLGSDSLHPCYPAVGLKELFEDCKHAQTIVIICALHYGRWSPLPISSKHENTLTLGMLLHIADFIAAQEDVIVNVD